MERGSGSSFVVGLRNPDGSYDLRETAGDVDEPFVARLKLMIEVARAARGENVRGPELRARNFVCKRSHRPHDRG